MLDGEDKLIEGAVRGKASAFGSLYDHYQPKIYRFVYLKVSQREDAEDLTHQVFLNAWQNIKNYRPLGFPFSSWLYQIARNLVTDHYRTKKTTIDLEDAPSEFFITATSIHSELDQEIELERVAEAMKKLKPDYQDVIIMRFIEELSLKETAVALKKSEGAVKLLQHRAMKDLKEFLA